MLDSATELRRFYKRTQPRLMAWVMVRVKDEKDAEEIVQDSYLGLLDSLPLFRGKSSLETFLVSIAKHEVMDYWRKMYAKKVIQTLPYADHFYAEKLYSGAETAAAIEGVYGKLKAREVQILKWKYEEEMTIVEIARKLEISLKAAESRLFRARQAFRLVYADERK